MVSVRVMVFSTTFNNISFILWQSVYWWRKPEYREKTTDLPQVTDNVLLSTPRHKFKGQGTSQSKHVMKHILWVHKILEGSWIGVLDLLNLCLKQLHM